MSLPRGWEQPGKVLKLIKSVYGLVQAPLHWFNKLSDGLIKVGLKLSALDPCLSIGEKGMCIVYVDDCLMFAHDVNDIDEIIQKIIEENFLLHVESDVAGFLGIDIECQDVGAIELKQSTSIQRIIDTLSFQNASPKATPAEVAELPADVDGPGPQECWSYSSVVGMLL
eukprot:15366495-Ditylum_brightwellii.AAC.3